tara:strand:- start:10 stop:195 length:186 start_codon:yes stop_codon:yes gene_type:complete
MLPAVSAVWAWVWLSPAGRVNRANAKAAKPAIIQRNVMMDLFLSSVDADHSSGTGLRHCYS